MPKPWLLALLLLGCSASGAPGEGPVTPRGGAAAPSKPNAATPGHSTVSLTGISGTFGPYRALRGDRAVLLWASPQDEGMVWYSAITDARGAAQESARQLRQAPDEVGLVRVQPVADRGYLALASSNDGGQSQLETLRIGERGELLGGETISEPPGEVVWLDVFTSSADAIAAWAVRGEGGAAELFAAVLDDAGQLASEPRSMAQGVIAWQGLGLEDGVAFAVVTPHATGESTGSVSVFFLDRAARPSTAVTVSPEPTAEADVDLARIGEHLLCAWSDVGQLQARVQLAVVDTRGKLSRPPRPVRGGVNEQALVRVVADEGSAHGYLLWEELSPNALLPRRFMLARVESSGEVSREQVEVRYDAGGGVPELQAGAKGGALLTQLNACPMRQNCGPGEPFGHFVRFDDDLQLLSAAPVQVSTPESQAADFVWGLECGALGCFALAALNESPARIFTVALTPAAGSLAAVAKPVKHSEPPLAVDSSIIAETEPLAKVAALGTSAGTLVAWVTDFDPNIPWIVPKDPAPDGRRAPVQALLQLALLADDGSRSPVEVISYRARTLGGVALAHNDQSGETLLVWSAIDQGKPHVFVTLVDARGNKVTQRMLTTSGGEVYDTAAVFTGDGFLVGWVDARAGTPHAYVAKIDKRLARRAPDRSLSDDGVSGIALARDGDKVAALFSRESEAGGSEAIYLTHLSPADASTLGEAQRMSSGTRHAHSPELAQHRDRLQALWLEDDSAELGANSRLMLSSFAQGTPGRPERGGAPPGASLRSVGMSCPAGPCRLAAVARLEDQRVVLLAGRVGSELKPLADLRAAAFSTAPALVGSALFVPDLSRSGRGWVRRVQVDW